MSEPEKIVWEGGYELQRDGYATGRPQVHAYIKQEKKSLRVNLTNGHCSWTVEIKLPEKWNP